MIAAESVEIGQFLERVSAEVEFGVEGHEGVAGLLGLQLLVQHGRHPNLVEGVDSADLQFQLLHSQVTVLVSVIHRKFLRLRQVSFYLARGTTLHPF
jgi:hypothetical protein